ncbi:hypothetical protein SAMN06265339_1071 [Desulfurobacterium pacificum]|jgi:hypothetical protein|uniref:Membrane or secreted protein n=1 Tax=Desulfurobacterium pacificum TaxID=240166 RepID=A0ABY1NLM7_9BACT|nr:hypothetical protein SAMN06265339_1071 [Desulfurobacterium pacificum]
MFKWIVLFLAIVGGLLLLFLAIGSTIRSEKG